MTRYFFLLLPLLPLMSSCALLGGGNAPEYPRAKGYQVTAPSEWTESSSHEKSDAAYTTKDGSVATLTSTCTDNKFNLEVLTKQLLLGARNVKYKEKRKLLVNGEEGQYSNVQANLDQNSFNILIFVLPKNNCVFDFTLVNPKTIDSKEQQEFNSFFTSFRYGTN